MAGNSFGSYFRITTFGESHGKAIGVLIDGVKPNMRISEKGIQDELNRRRPGQSKLTTPRTEKDQVQILSGIFEGKTLGTPICLLIRNEDQNPKAYYNIKNIFRPGHAGYTYLSKYGIHDYRGGGRASGRETAGRVAAGAIAKQILSKRNIQIIAYTKEVGDIVAKKIDYDEIEKNEVRCPNSRAAKKMAAKILQVKMEGDSIGGIVEAVVKDCPVGLGEPVFDKLEADLAKALMSIPAIKGFEIGSGFAASQMRGSEHNDEFYRESKTGRIRTRTNNAGGILGGISNGEDIVVRVAVKPTSSILKSQDTVDLRGRKQSVKIEGRHDPCLCPRIVPVIESMIALVLVDHLMRQKLLHSNKSFTSIVDEIRMIDEMLVLMFVQRRDMINKMNMLKKKDSQSLINFKKERYQFRKKLTILKDSDIDPKFIEHIFKFINTSFRKK